MSKSAPITVSEQDVQAAERERIALQRKVRQEPLDDKYLGISISGGGIRSASFAMGVLQGLQGRGFLKRFDYLSTVSGGGYIGSSWSWFNRLFQRGDLGEIPDDYFFPFGTPSQGARSGDAVSNKILSFIRQHGNYLVPGKGLNYVSGFAVVFRNMVLPLVVYISLMVSLFTMLIIGEGLAVIAIMKERAGGLLPFAPNLSMLLALATTLLFTVIGLSYGLVTFVLSRTRDLAYRVRISVQRIIGYLIVVDLRLRCLEPFRL